MAQANTGSLPLTARRPPIIHHVSVILISASLILSSACLPQALFAQVRINEIVASNVASWADEDADFPDWIELYNSGPSPVDLSGYYLSDDPDQPQKWVFGSTLIAAGEYMLVFASDKNRSGTSIYWESLVREGNVARYLIPSTNLADTWISADYSDANWQNGILGIGYGDGDDQTQVPYGTISVFTRIRFEVANLATVTQMLMHIDFDDGYVAYLNGREISRENLTGNAPLPFDLTANIYTEPVMALGGSLEAINLTEHLDVLYEGENVLAIQVHNYSAGSSDLTIIPFLTLGYSSPPSNSRGVADAVGLPEFQSTAAHTNFRLSSDGEFLALLSPDGSYADSVSFPSLRGDEAYGRLPYSPHEWKIFTQSTPNAENPSQGFDARLPNPVLSNPGGLYADDVDVAITDSSIAEHVYFTVDGSVPTIRSLAYGKAPRSVQRTLSMRLRTIQPGKIPSDVVTHTYIIGEEHFLPVVSVSTSPEHLWSPDSGIYVVGVNGIPGFCRNDPVNWNQDWEIPIHIELYEKDGSLGFSSQAGAKIFGGCSRTQPQKSLSVFFRGRYGNPELNYRLFQEKNIESFQAFVLRNSGNDFNDTHFRDGLMKTLAEDADLEYQAFRPAAVYLNGEYWGIHNIREKINEHFIASNSTADADEIDMLENNSWVIHGSDENYQEFLNHLNVSDLSDSSAYSTALSYMDIHNYIDYMISHIYYSNTDWPGNNVKYWRDRNRDGKWRWILYDTDFGFSMYGANYSHNTLAFALQTNGPEWPNPPWSTFVFRRMVRNEAFREAFATRMCDFMNSSYQPEHIASVIDSLASMISQEMPRHHNRWGGAFSTWENRTQVLKTFGARRPAFMKHYLQQEFGLGGLDSISVDVSEPAAGLVQVNRLRPKSFPWKGQYFEDIAIPLRAIPRSGYVFTGWTGDLSSVSAQIMISAGDSVVANFEESAAPTSEIVINEIMYNPSDGWDSGDWIELLNPTEDVVDLSGWTVKDSEDSRSFMLREGVVLNPGEYLILASDRDLFNSVYAAESRVLGDLGFGLSGSEDMVRLYNADGIVVDSVRYTDHSPWPDDSDGSGRSIELRDPLQDNSIAGNWRASEGLGGSPGLLNGSIVDFGNDFNPGRVELLTNYPNPFNPETRIRFVLSNRARVKVRILDLLGRQVALIPEAVFPEGSSEIRWNSGSLPSGTYFYELRAGRFTRQGKMTLIK